MEDLLDDREIVAISTDMSLAELGNLMRSHDLKTLPVLDQAGRLLGLVTIGDLAMVFMDSLIPTRDINSAPDILRELLSRQVADVMMTRDLVLFEKDESVEEARKHMLSTRYRNYPVVDEQNAFLGLFRYNLLEIRKTILVIIMSTKQAVKVGGNRNLEIIDHHRVDLLFHLSIS